MSAIFFRVRDDIKESLQMEDVYEVVSTFDRPNIFYGVKFINRTHTFREELAHEVMKDCKSGGSTIIYCTTIRDVEEVLLNQCSNISLLTSYIGNWHALWYFAFIMNSLYILLCLVVLDIT